jgi:RHS repeat-associated protein
MKNSTAKTDVKVINSKRYITEKGACKIRLRSRAAQSVCVILIVSILTISVPAAPRIFVSSISNWQQDILIMAYTNRLFEGFVFGFNEIFHYMNAQGQETQNSRNSKVVRITANLPKEIPVGGNVQLEAIPYDSSNIPVSGVPLEWEVVDPDGRIQTNLYGEYTAEKTGKYKITVSGAGKQNVSHLSVIEPSYIKKNTESQNDNLLDKNGSLNEPTLLPDKEWTQDNIERAREPRNRRGDTPGVPKENSNFNILAPVLAVAGRAGLDLNLNLTYNSRVWTKLGQDVSFDIDKDLPAPGWSIGFGKILNVAEKGIVQVDANGSKRFFSGIIKNDSYQKIFEGQSNDGSYIKAKTVTGGRVVSGQTCYTGSNTILKHPDGTSVEYDSNWDIGWNPSGNCISPGTTITLTPTTITDKHGNYISIVYHWHGSQDGRFIDYIKDTLGRVYKFNYTLINNRYYLTSITGFGLKDQNGTVIERTFVRLNYNDQTLSYQFNNLIPIVRSNNIKVLSSIYYPDTNTGYWFGATDSYSPYGMIRKIEEQRGMSFDSSTGNILSGQVTRRRIFSYPENTLTPLSDIPEYSTVTETWEGMPDSSSPAVTQYSVDWNSNPRTTSIALPYQKGKTIEYSYNYANLPDTDTNKIKDGVAYKTEFYDKNNVLRNTDETDWGIGSQTFSAHDNTLTYSLSTLRPTLITHSEYENGITLAKKSVYDQFGPYNRVEEMHEIGFNNETIRKTVTHYASDMNDSSIVSTGVNAPRIINRPEIIEVFDGDNTRIDYTRYTYDVSPRVMTFYFNGSYNEVPPNYHGGYIPPPSYPVGNLSSIIKYGKVTNSTLENQVADGRIYDYAGNIISYNPSSAGVDNTFFTYTSDTAYTFPSEIAKGQGNVSSALIKSISVYDFNTGLPISVKDANQQTMYFDYDIQNWRLKKTLSPTGAYTINDFDDFNKVYTRTDYASTGQIAGKNLTKVNGLGLAYRQQTLSGTDQQNQETWDVTEIEYDNSGKTKKTSTPFKSTDSLHGVYWSEVFYDWAGRIEKIKKPDGSEKLNFYNEQSRPQGASTGLGNTFRTKDPIGREKWHRTDSDGNVVEVIEPNPNGDGSVALNGFLTKYQYDRLDQLTRTEQGAQQRLFKYDSLGRVTNQKLAETRGTLDDNGNFVGEQTGQWSDFFSYDELSNISSITDARGVKTVYSYINPATGQKDALSRLFSVSYDTNGATDVLPSPTTRYAYRPQGNVSQVESIYTENTVNGSPQRVATYDFIYDSLGRVSDKKTTLPGKENNPLSVNYLYDSLSRVTDVFYPTQYGSTNPTRKNIHNTYDIEGRLNGLKVNNSDYASNFVFNASDQLTSINIGQSSPNQINEQYNYNPQTGLLENQKVLRGNTPLLDLSYQYQHCSCSTGGTGQITGIINNLDRNKDKFYEYDSLNRLRKVAGGLNQGWSQTYTYDRYGNRGNAVARGFESLRADGSSSKDPGNQRKAGEEFSGKNPLPTKNLLLDNIQSLINSEDANENTAEPPVNLYKQSESKESNITIPNKKDATVVINKQKAKNPETAKTATNSVNSVTSTQGTAFDFDGDGKADFSTWRRTNGTIPSGTWSVNNSQTGQNNTTQLGAGGNQIAPGDYDGDGKTDKAVWNPSNGNWTIKYSSTGNTVVINWGVKGDAIVPADYDGDGKTDIAIWRPNGGHWYIIRSSDNSWYTIQWGGQEYADIPTVGDYDGDGKADITVWRPSNGVWFALVLQSSSSQILYFQWGQVGDVPVPADYDGDGKTDLAVWRPSIGVWYISQSSNGQFTYAELGSETSRDVLVPADYDGDHKTDVAVWTPSTGTWTVRKSSAGTNITQQLGTKDDIAVPSAYIRRSSAPSGQSVEIPRDGYENLTFDTTSNRISTTGFQYDFAGNQTRIVRQDGTSLRFQYDAAGRLVKVKSDNQQTLVTYTYGLGRERLVTQEGDENSLNRTYYVWKNGSVISEFVDNVNNTLSWTKNYIYMSGQLLATQQQSGNSESVQFDHPDQLGTRVITDLGNGTSFEQNTLPFGTALDSESTGAINRRFTSYDRSSSTGLDYAVNRFYDSAQGRFTSVDPIKMSSTKILNPQTLNLYAYCANDPINHTDPSGLDGLPYGFVFNQGGFGGLGLPGSSGNSFFTGLGQFLTGALGNLFGGSNYAGRIFANLSPLNSGSITLSMPPPLPGAGTIESITTLGDNDNPCGYMANMLGNTVNDGMRSLGGSDKITTHDQINSLVANVNSVFTEFYTQQKGVPTSKGATARTDALGGPEGFKKQYKDSLKPEEDQTHHFAGYFNAGVLGRYWQATGHKYGTDYIGKEDNQGDRDLGDLAYSMGASLNLKRVRGLNSHGFPLKKDEPVADRLKRVLGIADRVRSEVCDN